MTYEFKCKECHTKFDKIMSLRQFESWKRKDFNITCPNCNGTDTTNVIGKPRVNLGDGFTRRAF